MKALHGGGDCDSAQQDPGPESRAPAEFGLQAGFSTDEPENSLKGRGSLTVQTLHAHNFMSLHINLIWKERRRCFCPK